MRLNENLSPGTLASDVSSEHECPCCGGWGAVEGRVIDEDYPEGREGPITCPDCSGLGVLNERVKR